MSDDGALMTQRRGTSQGLNRSLLDDASLDIDPEFGDAALGISGAEQCGWDGSLSTTAESDNDSLCVVVGARVPLRQQNPGRRRNRSPGRYHAGPGRSGDDDGRYLSPGRYHAGPGRSGDDDGRYLSPGRYHAGPGRSGDDDGRYLSPGRYRVRQGHVGSEDDFIARYITPSRKAGRGRDVSPRRSDAVKSACCSWDTDRGGVSGGGSVVSRSQSADRYSGFYRGQEDLERTGVSSRKPQANDRSAGRNQDRTGRDGHPKKYREYRDVPSRYLSPGWNQNVPANHHTSPNGNDGVTYGAVRSSRRQDLAKRYTSPARYPDSSSSSSSTNRYSAPPAKSPTPTRRYSTSPGRHQDNSTGRYGISPGRSSDGAGRSGVGPSRNDDHDTADNSSGRYGISPGRSSDGAGRSGVGPGRNDDHDTADNSTGRYGISPGRSSDGAGRSGVGPGRNDDHDTADNSTGRYGISPGRSSDRAGRSVVGPGRNDDHDTADNSTGGRVSRHCSTSAPDPPPPSSRLRRSRSAQDYRDGGYSEQAYARPPTPSWQHGHSPHSASKNSDPYHHHHHHHSGKSWTVGAKGRTGGRSEESAGDGRTSVHPWDQEHHHLSSSVYEKLEEEWNVYASQQDLNFATVLPSILSSHTLSSSSHSSRDVQSSDSSIPKSSSGSKPCVKQGSGSRLLCVESGSEDSVFSALEESTTLLDPPSVLEEEEEDQDGRSSAMLRDRTGSEQLPRDSDRDNGGDEAPALVSSLRTRSKSESDKLEEEEEPRGRRPSKTVHFSIFPYVREIPARQKTSSVGSSSRTISNLVTPERSGRTRSRIGVSQSQPGSRSTSPSSRGSYLTHTHAGRDPMTPKGKRKSGIPRSQGASREASPNRHTYGRERRLSGSKTGPGLMSQRVLRPGSDVEDALHDALSRPLRKRYDLYDSDDAASETSSVCSERSYTSYSGRTSEDMSEIIGLMGSGSYTERKDGLVSLQHLLRSSRYLSRVELKKVTEVFTRMFHDPHSKVFSIFLDTLSELCLAHGRDLTDWLYVLLTRLLNKTGTDMLGSVNAKLLRTLDTVRDTFPCDSQFNTITKFIIDQTQSPNLKVKISMLNYLHGLITVMEPCDFVNTMDTRLAVSRIINWTMEPRNVDVRKSAQLVLIGLFNLNPPEFSLMLAALPKAFQDGATKILHSHMRSASESTSDVLSPRNATSPVGQQRSRPPSRQSIGHPEECETENMNPEDIYNSIKKTSADIQNLSLGTKLEGGYEDIKKKRDFASQDSGIQELRNDSPDGVESRRGNLHVYNAHHYQDEGGLNGFGKSLLMDDGDTASDKEVTMADILQELSNHNERVRERRKMLDTLLKWVRNGTISEAQWDEHFKSILLSLIETFKDNDKTMRMDALIVFRSILKRQAPRFKDYAELTILKICEAHKDPSKDPGELQVQRAAEECALVIPTAINPEQALPILNNIIHTAKFPIHWAAIKMQVEVVKLVPSEVLERSLPNTVPGLIMGYDDSDSRVRKAAVFCLVNIYMQVGESLRPYLSDLNSSKTKLLNLYIKRAQEDSRSGIMSPVASDT